MVDAVLIASSEAASCRHWHQVTTLKEGSENNSLSLNANKTKVLIFERDEERTKCKISVTGKILEQVKEVVYLGSMFSRDGRYEMDVERRIAADNRVNGALAVLMRWRNVTTAARLAVYNAVLVPTLLYGSETWVLQKKNERKMNAVKMRSLRRICGIAGTSEDVAVSMKKNVFKFYAHVERMSGKRSRGRPRLTF